MRKALFRVFSMIVKEKKKFLLFLTFVLLIHPELEQKKCWGSPVKVGIHEQIIPIPSRSLLLKSSTGMHIRYYNKKIFTFRQIQSK